MFLAEQAFVLQLSLQRFERPPQRSFAGVLDFLHHELRVAPHLVHGQPGADQDLGAVDELHRYVAAAAPEQRTADLALLVLQREIDVPGTGPRDIGDFALDPYLRKLRLQQVLDAPVQGGNREHAAPRLLDRAGGGELTHGQK